MAFTVSDFEVSMFYYLLLTALGVKRQQYRNGDLRPHGGLDGSAHRLSIFCPPPASGSHRSYPCLLSLAVCRFRMQERMYDTYLSVSGVFDSVSCSPAFLQRVGFLPSSKMTGLGDVFLPLLSVHLLVNTNIVH